MIVHHQIRRIFLTISMMAALSMASSGVSAQTTMSTFCGLFLEDSKSRSDLMSIQEGLKKRNLYKGSIDGIFGKGSCNALTKWAQCEDLKRKVINKSSLRRLISANPSARDLDCYVTNSDPTLSRVTSTKKKVFSEEFTTVSVRFKNRWGHPVRVSIDGFLRQPSLSTQNKTLIRSNDFCLFGKNYINKNYCFKFNASESLISNTFSRFSKADKESVTDSCVLLATKYANIAALTNSVETKEFLKRSRIDFQQFAYRCLSVIQKLFPKTSYALVAAKIAKPAPSFFCNQSKIQEKLNKNALEELGLYTPFASGISKNYSNAVAGAEALLNRWIDNKKSCLGSAERKILEAVVRAKRLGSSCVGLPTPATIRTTFVSLKAANLTKTPSVKHEKVSGLIWFINTAASLEDKLSSLNFYTATNIHTRDCRLDIYELEALSPPSVSSTELTKMEKLKGPVVDVSTDTQRFTCKDDPSLCSVVQLCGKAASTVNGDIAWNTDAKASAYVALAKSSGLTCGLKSKPVVVAKAPTCEDDPTKCSLIELCQQATGTNTSGEKFWRMDAALQAYIDTAKSTGVTCGVVSKVIETAKLETCDNTPSKCSLAELCQRAISFETGKLGWTTTVNGASYVEFAKNSGMTCGVQENLVAAVPEQKQVEPPAPKKVLKYTNRKALVIGNANYVDQTPLKNPINDAKAVAAKLEQIGFEVTYKENLEYREFGRTIGDFERDVASSDISLIYYAGHGIEVDSVNYLIPIDAELRNPRAVKFETVMLEDAVKASLNTGKLSMVLVDACRDNPFTKSMIGSNRSVGRGLSIVDAQPGKIDQIISFAAESGEVAEDGTSNNSPYATSLLELLGEPNLEVGKLFRKLGDNVERMTNGKQIPVTRNRLSGEDIYLVVE